jgi:cytochrome c oxidase assembly protein subunit 15
MPESRILNPESFPDRHAIILWLSACALLVAMMVVIGGYTRLSGSGLSITEWKPIHGTIPPLNEMSWKEEFSTYQQSPQYLKVNKGMSLNEFKVIFWPEFIHRLLGRTIGVVFLIPFIVFVARGSVERGMAWRLAAVFALGGLQGLIGWLMVKSGLVDTPQVSAVRLALHLSVALLILGLLIWAILDVRCQVSGVRKEKLLPATCHLPPVTYLIWFTLLATQIIFGALMAGTHAGLMYNTWPDMNGRFLPEGWDALTLIQFAHRNLAVLVAVGFLFWWYFNHQYVKNNHLGKVCAGVTAIIAVQFALGVATLLNQVPLALALAHQMTALLLFTAAVILLHKVR